MSSLSRRDFVRTTAAAGAGLTIAAVLQGCRADPVPATDAPLAPNAWVRVRPDGVVTVIVDRSEMGQGVLTALPMLVAEELDADWSTVQCEQAPANAVYANKLAAGAEITGGSTSVMNGWLPLRRAGAQARALLVQAAAARWGVPSADCRTDKGRVVHDASGRSLGYGDVAIDAGSLPVPSDPPLKDPKDWRIIGQPLARLDVAAVVRGDGVFASDTRQPGMLVAVVARCPVFGGTVKSVDESRARAIPGVRQVVRLDTAVAVLAEDFWAAKKGREALVIEWNEGPLASLDSASIRATLVALAARPEGAVVRNDGDAAAALKGAAKTIQATYEVPYLAHATMEPMTCAADARDESCTIWAPTQAQWAPALSGGAAQGAAGKAAGVPMKRVTVNTTRLGGGFGRRAEQDFVIEAVTLSRAVGAPVRVVWTREDDIRHDYYRPATYNLLEGAVDASGRATAWSHIIAGPSIMERFIPSFLPAFVANRMSLLKHGADPTSIEGAENLPYDIPAVRVDYRKAEPGIPVGFWRSVGNSQNGFVTECFIDELAGLAGTDPVEFRRKLLRAQPRHLGVLDLAAERAGWGTPLPAGRGRGVAVVSSFGSYVAQVAEVSVEGGRPRVHRVVCAVDCGRIVNPDIVTAQVEGGVAYALSAALHGEITIEKGRVVQSNFTDYPVLRMNEMPVVEVHLMPSVELPGGVGEIAVPPLAPAVVNALAALTGIRVRRLPIRLSPA